MSYPVKLQPVADRAPDQLTHAQLEGEVARLREENALLKREHPLAKAMKDRDEYLAQRDQYIGQRDDANARERRVREALARMTEKADLLEARVERIVAAVQEHHDQHGDDRCHLDDIRLYYAVLGVGTDPYVCALPPDECMMESCRRFIEQRRYPGPEGVVSLPGGMTIAQLTAEVERLRGIESDRDAYAGAALGGLSAFGCTPEQGYVKDGGASLMASDFRRAVEEYRRAKGDRATLRSCMGSIHAHAVASQRLAEENDISAWDRIISIASATLEAAAGEGKC